MTRDEASIERETRFNPADAVALLSLLGIEMFDAAEMRSAEQVISDGLDDGTIRESDLNGATITLAVRRLGRAASTQT